MEKRDSITPAGSLEAALEERGVGVEVADFLLPLFFLGFLEPEDFFVTSSCVVKRANEVLKRGLDLG